MALRRRAGADTVDLDTVKGFAHFAYFSPRKIDMALLQRAAHDAAYSIKRLELEVRGEVVKAACTTCRRETHFLRVDKTKQLIEIGETLPIGSKGLARLSATSWSKDSLGLLKVKGHIVFKVESFVPVIPKESGRASEPIGVEAN
jgi:hypothetical protein